MSSSQAANTTGRTATASSHIPRPPNSFILFRTDLVREWTSQNPDGNINQRLASGVVSKIWKAASNDVRATYDELAKQKKAEHADLYPGYRFQPKRKSEKERLKAQEKKQKKLEKQRQKMADRRGSRTEDPLSLGPIQLPFPAPASTIVQTGPVVRGVSSTIPPQAIGSQPLPPNIAFGEDPTFTVNSQSPAVETHLTNPYPPAPNAGVLHRPKYAPRLSVQQTSNPPVCRDNASHDPACQCAKCMRHKSQGAESVPHVTPHKSSTSRNRMSITSLLNSPRPAPSNKPVNRRGILKSTKQSQQTAGAERFPPLRLVSNWDTAPLANAGTDRNRDSQSSDESPGISYDTTLSGSLQVPTGPHVAESSTSLLANPAPMDTTDSQRCSSTSKERPQQLVGAERLTDLHRHTTSELDNTPLAHVSSRRTQHSPKSQSSELSSGESIDSLFLTRRRVADGDTVLPSTENNSDHDISDLEDAVSVYDMLVGTESEPENFHPRSPPLSVCSAAEDSAIDYDSAWEVSSVSSLEHARWSGPSTFNHIDFSGTGSGNGWWNSNMDFSGVKTFAHNSVDPYEGDVEDVDPRDGEASEPGSSAMVIAPVFDSRDRIARIKSHITNMNKHDIPSFIAEIKRSLSNSTDYDENVPADISDAVKTFIMSLNEHSPYWSD